MNPHEIFVSVISWEDRFLLGLQNHLRQNNISGVVFFRFEEYLDRTAKNAEAAFALCKDVGIVPICEVISFGDQVVSWKKIFRTISKVEPIGKKFTIDITTMPRETIWTLLNLLDISGVQLRCVYSQPNTYESWLSRDPAKPRIPFKLGGIPDLDKPKSLLMTTGFSPDRALQLIEFYEPKEIFIAVQAGEQFENRKRNIDNNEEVLRNYSDVHYFEIDAYDRGTCYQILKEKVSTIVESSNLIMSSLGPKLSAIDLYKIHKDFENTALAYTPSNEYNTVYSSGIRETITDVIRN